MARICWRLSLVTAMAFALALGQRVRAATDDDGWTRFRETYRELVETNTTLSQGD